MCGLCSTDEKERALGVARAERLADHLERLASIYYAMARGTIKPHTSELRKHESIARGVVRDLVAEWV